MSTFLEIGPGRGDFLFRLAEENPDATVAAIEYKRKRFDKLVRRLGKKALPNVRLLMGDARFLLPQEFSENSVDKIFILFSDPWPKRRHAKHRLFQQEFVRKLIRVLVPDGQIFIAHDDPVYISQIREVFLPFSPELLSSEDGIDFRTFYADKWLREGRAIYSFSYRKRANEDASIGFIPCERRSER